MVGTGTFGAGGNRANNMSTLSCRSDRLQTPMSKHSRKSSSASIQRDSSQQMASILRPKQRKKMSSLEKQKESNMKGDNCSFQIFSTVDDSPYVVCVAPTATSQIGLNSRYLRQHLMTAEDLACLKTGDQMC